MKKKSKFVLALFSGILFLGLIGLIRLADVAPIGPEGTSIGLSHLNNFVFNMTGVNILWYNITDWLGAIAILTAFVFAIIGFVQMIKRKNPFKVDREILCLGSLYLIVIAVYIFFEKFIVNYRPVIMPDCQHVEASFPSSHTMIVCVIMGSVIMVLKKYVKNTALRKILYIFCAAVITVTVMGRLISGVHWFTDIMGGILISISLLSLFSGAAENKKSIKQ